MSPAGKGKFGVSADKSAKVSSSDAETTQPENREHPRFDVHTTGTLKLETGFKLNFAVKDMSQRGAKILLESSVILPERFTVEIISPDKKKIKRCKSSRQWQRGPLVGIKLLSSETIVL